MLLLYWPGTSSFARCTTGFCMLFDLGMALISKFWTKELVPLLALSYWALLGTQHLISLACTDSDDARLALGWGCRLIDQWS